MKKYYYGGQSKLNPNSNPNLDLDFQSHMSYIPTRTKTQVQRSIGSKDRE